MCEPGSIDPRRPLNDLPVGRMTVVLMAGLGLLALLACDRRPAPLPERKTGAAVDGCNGVADGALCNDRNACTLNDHCMGGLCVGTVAPDGSSCTDDNQCTTADMCVQGKCQGSPAPDGTLCTDGDPCTDPDTCRKGVCTAGGPNACDDNDRCTTDMCIEDVGCRHDPMPVCPEAGTGGDGGSTVDADAGPPPDGALPDLGPDGSDAEAGASGDASEDILPDAPPPDGAPEGEPDGGEGDDAADAATDGAVDATDATEPVDAPDGGLADATADGGPDGADAGGADVLPLYQAQGGACVCSSGSASPGSGGALALVLGALGLIWRPGRRGAR